MTDTSDTQIVIYQNADSSVDVRLDGVRETVWLTLQQIADLFARDKSVVSRHLRNIYKDGELTREATVAKNASVQTEGDRAVRRDVTFYDLDAIISVGYRVNSKRAVQFRQWATRVLREHLLHGWTLSRQRFATNARELDAAMELLHKTAQSTALDTASGRGLVDIATRYAQTFLLLQRYDEGLLTEPKAQSGGVLPTLDNARSALAELKTELIERGEASDLFARERGDGFDALLANLDQSILGEPAYPSIEAKAAHLHYFVVKNHPFSDGNKRSAAFLFVDFLHGNHRLLDAKGEPIVNDIGLAALTLLVAESDPSAKDVMIRLIMNMLAAGQ